MDDEDDFSGGQDSPKMTPEQQAHERRLKQKSDKHERMTKQLTQLSQSFPEAHKILKEYVEYEIFTLETIMANANDSDILLKYSGAMKAYKELLEKLDLYKDFL